MLAPFERREVMVRILAQFKVRLEYGPRFKREFKVRLEYDPRFKRGDIVAVDALKLAPQGLMFRVVHVWKKPAWFHSDWFEGIVERRK